MSKLRSGTEMSRAEAVSLLSRQIAGLVTGLDSGLVDTSAWAAHGEALMRRLERDGVMICRANPDVTIENSLVIRRSVGSVAELD